MELAYKCGKPVIPVVLNVPFHEWPPRQIGKTVLQDQFGTTAGDVKIFVDMSDPSNFFQKFMQELMPRLAVRMPVRSGRTGSAVSKGEVVAAARKASAAARASEAALAGSSPGAGGGGGGGAFDKPPAGHFYPSNTFGT